METLTTVQFLFFIGCAVFSIANGKWLPGEIANEQEEFESQGYFNVPDGPLYFTCENFKYLTYMKSEYRRSEKDRVWKYACRSGELVPLYLLECYFFVFSCVFFSIYSS